MARVGKLSFDLSGNIHQKLIGFDHYTPSEIKKCQNRWNKSNVDIDYYFSVMRSNLLVWKKDNNSLASLSMYNIHIEEVIPQEEIDHKSKKRFPCVWLTKILQLFLYSHGVVINNINNVYTISDIYFFVKYWKDFRWEMYSHSLHPCFFFTDIFL